MDGRDAFLTTAREKHYEFSSFRRAKFSTMAMLHELHALNQSQFVYTYTCNNCKKVVETRYHCHTCDVSICTRARWDARVRASTFPATVLYEGCAFSVVQDFDLCIACYQQDGHPHKMDRLGLGLDEGIEQPTDNKTNPQVSIRAVAREECGSVIWILMRCYRLQEARTLSIQRCIQSLVHACQCRDANCRLASCQRMKRVVQHTKACKTKVNGNCPVCKQLIALCFYHAKYCTVSIGSHQVVSCPGWCFSFADC